MLRRKKLGNVIVKGSSECKQNVSEGKELLEIYPTEETAIEVDRLK